MKTYQDSMYLFAEADGEKACGYKLTLVPERYRYYMPCEAVNLGETLVLYEVPEGLTPDILRFRAIETLRDRKKKILADTQLEINKLDKQIQDLQLLTQSKGAV